MAAAPQRYIAGDDFIEANSAVDGTHAQDDHCTLREAILNANGNNQSDSPDCGSGAGIDVIVFSKGLTYLITITLKSELPGIAEDLIIKSSGSDHLEISGDNTYRIKRPKRSLSR